MKYLQLKGEKKTGLLKKIEPEYKSQIGLSTKEGIHLIYINDILFLHASGNYTEVHLVNDKKIVVSKTLKIIEEKLPPSSFKRCHQSYVINLKEVVLLRDYILLSNNAAIPISRRKRKEITRWFANKVVFV